MTFLCIVYLREGISGLPLDAILSLTYRIEHGTTRRAATELGVRLDALWHWEHNGRFPYPKALPAIERYLGYRLAPPVADLGACLRTWRNEEGLSLVDAGTQLGLDAHTLSDLEHGREVTLPVRLAVSDGHTDRSLSKKGTRRPPR